MQFDLDRAAMDLTYSMLQPGPHRRIAELIGLDGYLWLCRGRCYYFPSAERLSRKDRIITASRVRPKDRPLVQLIGLQAYIALLDFCGGKKIYFPRRAVVLRPIRDAKVREAYSSGKWTVGEIAAFFDVTEGWIQKLCTGIAGERVTSDK